MRSRLVNLVIAATSAGVCSTVVAGPLALDATAIPGFHGSVNYLTANLDMTLDYAVFAPGQYPDDLVFGNDPSNGSQYVYAYQGFAATRPFTTVSVGRVAGGLASNPGADALHQATGGVLPSLAVVQASSVFFFWTPPAGVPAGSRSAVFLFTSPQPPTFASTSVANGAFSQQLSAPSPLPEPASVLLLALMGLRVLRRR